MTMEQLEKHLGTQDVEAKLRRACRLNLTLHAEMQIVVFYEGNPSSAPPDAVHRDEQEGLLSLPRVSAPASAETAGFGLSPEDLPVMDATTVLPNSWTFKSTPFVKLSKNIEQLTKRELKAALTAPRRPRNQDSTAGPSLTITATVPTGLGSRQPAKVQFTLKDGSLSEDLE